MVDPRRIIEWPVCRAKIRHPYPICDQSSEHSLNTRKTLPGHVFRNQPTESVQRCEKSNHQQTKPIKWKCAGNLALIDLPSPTQFFFPQTAQLSNFGAEPRVFLRRKSRQMGRLFSGKKIVRRVRVILYFLVLCCCVRQGLLRAVVIPVFFHFLPLAQHTSSFLGVRSGKDLERATSAPTFVHTMNRTNQITLAFSSRAHRSSKQNS